MVKSKNKNPNVKRSPQRDFASGNIHFEAHVVNFIINVVSSKLINQICIRNSNGTLSSDF
jgi:hypothetical protein